MKSRIATILLILMTMSWLSSIIEAIPCDNEPLAQAAAHDARDTHNVPDHDCHAGACHFGHCSHAWPPAQGPSLISATATSVQATPYSFAKTASYSRPLIRPPMWS